MQTLKVGFIGLGEMGILMAKNIVKSGFQTTVYDLRKEPLAELELAGATIAKSVGDAAKDSDIVISMVVNESQTNQVVTEALKTIKKNAIILITSTVSPAVVRNLAKIAQNENDVAVLDAPVSGGPIRAAEGILSIMAGGDKQAFEMSRPVMEAMGKEIFYCGDVGLGLVAKITNNAIAIATIALCSEVIPLGLKHGLDPDVQLDVYMNSTASSAMLEYWKIVCEMRKDHTYVKNILGKDLQLALELAKESGVPFPIVDQSSKADLSL